MRSSSGKESKPTIVVEECETEGDLLRKLLCQADVASRWGLGSQERCGAEGSCRKESRMGATREASINGCRRSIRVHARHARGTTKHWLGARK